MPASGAPAASHRFGLEPGSSKGCSNSSHRPERSSGYTEGTERYADTRLRPSRWPGDMGRVPLFAIYPVFAIRIHGGEAHYLIGASQRHLKGWLPGRYGAILDRALAVRPRPNAAGLSISDPHEKFPGPELAQVLYRPADKQTNLQAHPVYPVLSDDGDSLELAVPATDCSSVCLVQWKSGPLGTDARMPNKRQRRWLGSIFCSSSTAENPQDPSWISWPHCRTL